MILLAALYSSGHIKTNPRPDKTCGSKNHLSLRQLLPQEMHSVRMIIQVINRNSFLNRRFHMDDEISAGNEGPIAAPLENSSKGPVIKLPESLIEQYALEGGDTIGCLIQFVDDELRITVDLSVESREYSHIRTLYRRSKNILSLYFPKQCTTALELETLARQGAQAIVCETGPTSFTFRFEPRLLPWSSSIQETPRGVSYLSPQQRVVTPVKNPEKPLGISHYRFRFPGFWVWAYDIEAGDTVACRYTVAQDTLGIALDLEPAPDESTSITRQINQRQGDSGRSERHLYAYLPKQLFQSLGLGFEPQAEPITVIPGPRHLTVVPQGVVCTIGG
jgi:hypothetical protein